MHVLPQTMLFGRVEKVDNDELFHANEPMHGQIFDVRKLSVGFVHVFFSAGNVKFGAGALASRYWKSAALDSVYGADPASYMLFFRAKLAMK